MQRRFHVLLSLHFGIHPWDYDRLTVDQFVAYCDQAEQLNKKADDDG